MEFTRVRNLVAGSWLDGDAGTHAPFFLQRMRRLLQEAGLPPGVVNLVHGNRTVVEPWYEHPAVSGICLVGSTPTAKEMAARCGRGGKRSMLLGGAKNWLDAMEAGLFIGSAVHDTAQVAATGLMHDRLWGLRTGSGSSVADMAVATKLLRNAFMIVVITVISLAFRSGCADGGRAPRIASAVPLFVLGYLAMAALRTLGDLAFVSAPKVWRGFLALADRAGTWLATVAVASVGPGTDFRRLRGLGGRPVLAGLLSALIEATRAAVLIRFFVGTERS